MKPRALPTPSPVAKRAAKALSAPLPGPDDVLREVYKRSLYRFIQDFWPIVEPAEALVDTQLMQTMADHGQKFLEAMVADLRGEAWAKGYFQDLGVEVPPGSSKSMMFAVFLPAFAWGPMGCPWLRWIFSTYERNLTLRDSRRRRDLMKSPLYQRLWGHLVQFKGDTDQQNYYENTRRGFCMSTSVGGSGTGHRAHVFVGDDLLNAIEANSASAQEAVIEHLKAMSSRGVRQEQYRRLIIGQRLSEKDPGGWARESGFEVLSLPTEFDPDRTEPTRIWTDWRTVRGELLNPLRMSATAVAKARIALGPYGFGAQHNQRPVPADGGVLKLDWLVDRPALARGRYLALLSFYDTAYTQKVHNDETGRVVIGIRNDDMGIDLLHVDGWHHEFPALVKAVKEDCQDWEPQLVGIEAKANGLSLIQQLDAATDFPFHVLPIEIPSGFDKNNRAHAAAPFVARGLVGIDWSQPWAQTFREQLEVFPAGKKRDRADAFVHAVLHIDKHYRFNIEQPMAYQSVPVQQDLAEVPADTKPASFNKPPVEPAYDPDDVQRSDFDSI